MDAKSNLVGLPANPTDQEKADAYRNEVRPLLEQLCGLRDRAKRDGLSVDFSIGLYQFGRSIVASIVISKPL